jgi:F-type H+-transporting ATPase subunit b
MLKQMVLMLAMALGLALPAARAADAPHDAEHGAAVEAAGSDAHGAGHDAHAKPPLIPDFTSRETQLQALWVVIIFIVLLIILYPTAWKNVLAGLKAREQRIRADIANAEAARAKAEATLQQYNEQLATAEGKIRDMMAKASADAEKLATNLRMQAQQETEEIKERANREIEAARKAAVRDIYAQAAELSTNIAEKILRRNLNADDQRALVNESLERLQTVGKA